MSNVTRDCSLHLSRREVLVLGAGATAAMNTTPTNAANAQSTNPNERTADMSYVRTKDGVDIFHRDWGFKDAQPIAFHHGWPLSADDWDIQMLYFLSKGYRVVAHDRRGHGRSTQVAEGNDMDH